MLLCQCSHYEVVGIVLEICVIETYELRDRSNSYVTVSEQMEHAAPIDGPVLAHGWWRKLEQYSASQITRTSLGEEATFNIDCSFVLSIGRFRYICEKGLCFLLVPV